MPDAYDFSDAKFINFIRSVSAADALFIQTGYVPVGKVWTFLGACAVPSVNETRTFWFAVEAPSSGFAIPVTLPQSFAAVTASQLFLPMLREGMELRCYPGERLYVFRDAATAGSTIELRAKYIESDMPLYEYTEPQERRRLRRSAVEVIKARGGGGGAFASRSIPTPSSRERPTRE